MFEILLRLKNGYTTPATPPIDQVGKKECENNAKAKNEILCGLTNFEFVKVMHCKSVKEIWDKFKPFMKDIQR